MNSDDRLLLNSLPEDMRDFIESKLKWITEKEKTPMELSPNKRIFCNTCKIPTNHICLHNSCKHNLASLQRLVLFHVWGHQLWMCAGCENITLENYTIDESFVSFKGEIENDDDTEETYQTPEVTSVFFPKRTEYNLKAKYYTQLPKRLENLYKEIIVAFNNETPILCAIGIRALIEGICFDHEITGRNLEKKIEGMTIILPKNIVANLHNLRFMGNEAAHELNAPPQKELQMAIDICEDLLNYLYELDYKTSNLNTVRN